MDIKEDIKPNLEEIHSKIDAVRGLAVARARLHKLKESGDINEFNYVLSLQNILFLYSVMNNDK